MNKHMLESYHCNFYEDKQYLEDHSSLEKLTSMLMWVTIYILCIDFSKKPLKNYEKLLGN